MSNDRKQDELFPSTGTSMAQPEPTSSPENKVAPPQADQQSADAPTPVRETLSSEELRKLGAEAMERVDAVKQRVKNADPKTLSWAEKVLRNAARKEERQKKTREKAASTDIAAAVSPEARKPPSRKATLRAASAEVAGENLSVAPTRRQRRPAKNTAEDKGNSDNIAEQPSAAAKPKRSRRKAAPANTPEQAGNNLLPTGSNEAPSSDAPPITSEAIAFLGNQDAKAVDLFKLAPDSQAFVQYHITNMQRLEADSALAHTYLLANAPKYSPRFEKAVDVLVSKLSRDRPPLAKVPDTPLQSASTPPEKANNDYRPRPASMQPQPAITVSLKKPVLQGAGGPPHERFEENSIEPGHPVAQTPGQTEASDRASTSAKGPAVSGGRRLLNELEAAFRSTAKWLQQKRMEATIDTKAPDSGSGSANKSVTPPIDKSTSVPDEVARRFLKVNRDYYFPDKTPAFSDRGNKLAMRGEHPEVVRSLVDIARARGWENITVKGTEAFRRAAWMEASQAGLVVSGYQPTGLDLADLARRPGGNVIEKAEAKNHSNVAPVNIHKGVAQEAKASNVEEETRGLSDGLPHGDVDARRTAKANAFGNGKPIIAIKKHPDLAPAYGVVDAAKKFAEKYLPESARAEFIGLALRHVMNKIMSGEPVPGPKVYMAPLSAKKRTDAREPADGNALASGKSPKTKEIAHEK